MRCAAGMTGITSGICPEHLPVYGADGQVNRGRQTGVSVGCDYRRLCDLQCEKGAGGRKCGRVEVRSGEERRGMTVSRRNTEYEWM